NEKTSLCANGKLNWTPESRARKRIWKWNKIMRKRVIALSGIALVLTLGYGCRSGNGAAPSGATPPQAVNPEAKADPSEPTASKTPVKDAITELLAKAENEQDSPFPKGVKLLGVNLEDGVVTLDFSSEFNKLANMGDTTESQ